MYIYILLVPSSIILIVALVQLTKISKHDNALYPFCQLRRNILSLLRREGLDMDKEDYELTNYLLEATSITIHEFNKFKLELFNIKNLKKLLIKSFHIDNDKSLFKHTENKKISKLQDQFRYCVIKATQAYTPFLRSRIILFLMIIVSEFLFRMSVKRAKNFINYLEKYKSQDKWINSHDNQQNLYIGV